MIKKITLFAILFVLSTWIAEAQQLNLFPGVIIKGESYINSISQTSDGNYLISPYVDHVNGIPCGNLAKVDATGNLITSFNRIIADNHILKSFPLADGKILIGGWFRTVNGRATSLARLNGNGTIDDTFEKFEVPVNTSVSTFAVQSDGKIVVVGSFTKNGYRGIIRLNSDGSVDNSFLPFFAPLGFLSKLELDDEDNIFTSEGSSLFKLSAGGSPITGFPLALNTSGSISMIRMLGNKIVIGGSFSTVGGLSRKNIAIVNADGTIDPFSLPDAPNVDRFAITNDDKILISDINQVKVFESNGTQRPAIANGRINHIHIDNSQKIIITGIEIKTANGATNPFMVRFNSNLTVDNSFVCEATYTTGITALASLPDGRILVGGGYPYAGIKGTTKKLARINLNGTIDNSFQPNIPVSAEIKSLAVQADGKILVAIDKLIRLNTSGAIDNSFIQIQKTPVTTETYAMSIVKLRNEKIFLSGAFDQVNNYASPGLVKLNLNGTIDNSFVSALPQGSYVKDFGFLSNNKIIVTGSFVINGNAKAVVRLNENGTLDETFNMGSVVYNEIRRVAIDSRNKIYLSGDFMGYNGLAIDKIVRLSSHGSIDNAFSPDIPFDINSAVRGLELLSDNEIILGEAAGYGTNCLVVYDSLGSLKDREFTALSENSSVQTSYFNGETLYIAGRITNDQSAISGISYLNIHAVAGTITNLHASRNEPTNATLSWTNNVSKASLLILERSITTNTAFTPLDTIPAGATSYVDSGLLGSKDYYYRIRAVNTSSTTGYSAEAYLPALLGQTINFGSFSELTRVDTSFVLIAMASSQLPVTFATSNNTIASIANNTVTIHTAGTVKITASQPGNGVYDAAVPVEQTLVINAITSTEVVNLIASYAYPNPSKGLFRIALPDQPERGAYSILSSDGIMVEHAPVVVNQGTVSFDLSEFKAGLYVIKIDQGKRPTYFKIIKE
jgi:uncharacterized delta-60 repeat protein